MKRLRKWLKNRWVIVGIIILVLILASKIPTPFTPSKKSNQYTVTRQNIRQTLTLSGTIDADQKATLQFQTSGRLVWVGVKPGDKVAAYQTIASLDQQQVQKSLEIQLNNYMKTRWDFEQLHDDNKSKIITDALKRILEKSQFDLNNAVLNVEIQHLAVEFSNIVTPISGVVTAVNPSVAGVNVTPATSEFDVVDPNSVYLSVLADQTEVTKLSEDMKPDIIFDAYPNQHIEGAVVSIGFTPKTGETSTVYEVKVKLPINNDDYHYRVGMTADAAFTTREKPQVIAIPAEFLKEDKSGKYVLKHIKGKIQRSSVSVGEETDALVEITSGLSEGETIYD
ncbi:efflux RND transporter periplasmic adaptor subunit [Candidatus Gottesmanbacteria bacterium]|nr:efflux RND transporter periplasmic adaptor subunit [Candidatus Gottesmanbacteria bacterium]